MKYPHLYAALGIIFSGNAFAACTPPTYPGDGICAAAPTSLFTSGAAGLVPASGGGTTNFLRADGTFASPGGSGSPGGSNTQIQYNNSGSFGASSTFVFDGTAMAVGNSAPLTFQSVSKPLMQNLGTSLANSGRIVLGLWTTTAPATAEVELYKSRGASVGSAGAVSNNDVLGMIVGLGDDGTATQGIDGADIQFSADGNWSSGSTPGKIIFRTDPGNNTQVNRFQINSSGNAFVATSIQLFDQSGNLYGQGTIGVSCAANTVNLTTFTIVGGVVTHC